MRRLERVITKMASVSFVLILMLTLVQVFCRTIIRVGVPWTEEINRMIFIYLVYLGAAVSVLRGEMIVVDTVVQTLKGSLRSIVNKIIHIFNICFMAIMLISGIQMLWTAWPTTFATVPWLSNGVLYVPLIFSVAVMLFKFVFALFEREV